MVQEGINADGVTAWFGDHVEGVRPPLSFDLIAGGRSNLTYRVTDAAGNAWALRRPPVAHVLPTAHDMTREHRIIDALGRHTSVPVAPAIGLCTDEAVNGAPFYVMGFVEGHVLRDAKAAAVLDEKARTVAAESLVDVLVDLHAVDPGAVGLGDLGRHDGYIERQLRRWHTQFQKSTELTARTVPLVDEMHDRLLAAVPEQDGVSIVHGDYRLDNAIVGDDGHLRAVLDWEICTLGDPLADVGLLMCYWSEPEDPTSALLVSPTVLPGFPRRADLIERYAARSGRDLSRVGFYVAFGYWKLACIIEGVYSRYLGGAGGGDRTAFEGFAGHVVALAEMSRDAAEGLA